MVVAGVSGEQQVLNCRRPVKEIMQEVLCLQKLLRKDVLEGRDEMYACVLKGLALARTQSLGADFTSPNPPTRLPNQRE